MGQQLVINSLIKYKDTGIVERILWVDKLVNLIVAINIFDNSWPVFRELNHIKELINEKELEVIMDDPFFRLANEEDLSIKGKNKRDFAWNILQLIFSEINKPNVFIKEERREVVKKTISEFNISRNSVDNYLKKFWKRGQVKNSLIADFENCGGPGRDRKSSEKKRGRKRIINSGSEGINIDDSIKRIFRVSINRYYNTTKKNPLTIVYELMIRDFFTEKYEDSNKKEFILIEGREIPTIQQFRYWFNKERNDKNEIVKRYSKKEYELKSRALVGRTRSDALYPSAKIEIDATIADVYLVSRYNRNWIIGRSVVYFAIDKFSSMIVGLNVTLEGPSFNGAVGALANCFMDKKSFCKEYDIDIQENEWPTAFLPDILICDRGELIGKGIESITNNLGVTVEQTSSFRGDMKALVERNFRTINSRVKPFTPGFIDSDFQKRGGHDYRLDSTLDLYQFTQIMINCILYYNKNNVLSGYDRDTLMIKDLVRPVPIELWKWGIKNRSGTLRKVDDNKVKLYLMQRTKNATVTEKGIRLRGMYYGSETAFKERWFEKARINGYWKVEIAFDSRSMNKIYLILDNGKSYEGCNLLEHQSRYLDKTLEEIDYLLLQEKINNIETNKMVLQPKINLYTEIEEIVDKANKMTHMAQNTFESNTSKLKGIRGYRENEKLINRENELFILDEDKRSKETELGSDVLENVNYESNDILLLRKKQKERKSEK